ncbi:hypothetical protein D9757_012995 [Collybiopsis confluens]|uniref:Uncharacterized protein n=1 Tax=Collybiopsis confluens TaxID=2823264 RepID=A0A8H5GII1_9AGAR|nr:hypothetical protein D9757_012995 [Collybiopsis confluens]
MYPTFIQRRALRVIEGRKIEIRASNPVKLGHEEEAERRCESTQELKKDQVSASALRLFQVFSDRSACALNYQCYVKNLKRPEREDTHQIIVQQSHATGKNIPLTLTPKKKVTSTELITFLIELNFTQYSVGKLPSTLYISSYEDLLQTKPPRNTSNGDSVISSAETLDIYGKSMMYLQFDPTVKRPDLSFSSQGSDPPLMGKLF